MVSAITMQVLLCLLVIGSLILCKKGNEPLYRALKQEYTVMTTVGSQTGDSFAALLTSLAGTLNRPGQLLMEWVENFLTGEKQPRQEAQQAAITTEEPDAEEPREQEITNRFAYNYLEQEDTLISLGAGGAYPIANAAIPPEVSLAPVVLGGYLKPPITGLVTSPFGYRAHPVTQAWDFHTGMDIAAEEGRAILAALPGEVVEVGESQIYGRYIILQHATNLRTFYGHCSEILAEEGAKIRQGERIARVGATGVATGPHLHFSVIVEGKFTDPYWVLKDNLELLA